MASLLVPSVNADLVILVSDIDGLYDCDPHVNKNAKLIQEIYGINSQIETMAADTNTNMGTGGMITKIRAAKICNEYGCDLAIVNGKQKNALIDLVNGKQIGTLFHGDIGRNLNARQHWIMYQSWSKGSIVVDDGCKIALKNHKSLLPSGIIKVNGSFTMSTIVEILDEREDKIGKGIVNYSSEEINLIKGKNTSEIINILPTNDYDEVIHANNLVLVQGGKHD